MVRKGFAHILLILLIVVLAGVGAAVVWQSYGRNWNLNLTAKKTIVKQVLVRRSKTPGVIVRATTAKAIDVKTGKVITAANVFSTNDKTVYLALDLNSPKVGTRIDYIRYLNNRYVDHGSVKIDKPNTSNVDFDWTVTRFLGSRPDGKYKVATYADGILEKRVLYTIEKNKLSSVSVEDAEAVDSDYYLPSDLLAVR